MNMKITCAAVLLSTALGQHAIASTYQLDATIALGTGAGGFSNFSVTFDDKDNNTLLGDTEMLVFGGVDIAFKHYYALLFIPVATGFADGTSSSWFFAGAGGATTTMGPERYRYKLTKLTGTQPNPVPLPAAGWALMAGLGALWSFRRKGSGASSGPIALA